MAGWFDVRGLLRVSSGTVLVHLSTITPPVHPIV